MFRLPPNHHLFHDNRQVPSDCINRDYFVCRMIDCHTLYLYDNRANMLGYIDLALLGRTGAWETHVRVMKEENRGKGYGILLYAKAFEFALARGMTIVSSEAPSPSARRVWQSARLNGRYKIVKKGKRFSLVGRQEKKVAA